MRARVRKHSRERSVQADGLRFGRSSYGWGFHCVNTAQESPGYLTRVWRGMGSGYGGSTDAC
jgi:hypothetical protein